MTFIKYKCHKSKYVLFQIYQITQTYKFEKNLNQMCNSSQKIYQFSQEIYFVIIIYIFEMWRKK
jgi:hypothetical protein